LGNAKSNRLARRARRSLALQDANEKRRSTWIPACAGMTSKEKSWIPALAGMTSYKKRFPVELKEMRYMSMEATK
jgi:hypothetical protein